MKQISPRPDQVRFFQNPFLVLTAILGRMKLKPPPEMSSEGIELEERIPITVRKPKKVVITKIPTGHRKSFNRK